MRTQNWAVLYEVVKVIHDNGNEEVEDKKAADKDETGEKEEGEVGSTACGISLVWVWITDCCLGRELVMKGSDKVVSDRRGGTGKHDLLPTFPGCRAKKKEESLNQLLKKHLTEMSRSINIILIISAAEMKLQKW